MLSENEFRRVDGSLALVDVISRSDEPLPVVIEFAGAYWVLTPEELDGLANQAADFEMSVGELVASLYRPAALTETDTPDWAWPGWRAVVLEGDRVVNAGIAGPLEPLVATTDEEPNRGLGPSRGEPEAAAPPPPAMAEPGVPTNGGDRSSEEDGSDGELWELSTQFPREVTLGSVASLIVELGREATQGPDTSVLRVALEAGAPVDVVVQPKKGFIVEGPAEGRLTADENSLPLRFQLRANEEGQGMVRVLFFVEATALGAITLEPIIRAEGAVADASAVASSEVISTLTVGGGRPDLELLVLEEMNGPNARYSIRVTAADEGLGLHLREFGPIELLSDPRRFFAETFADIEKLDLSTADARARAQRLLESKGNYLFTTLVPEQLRAVLWDIRDRITRVRVDSEEPYIPWELIRLSGPGDDGTVVEDRFLCEYEFTRWLPGMGLNSLLTLADFGIVIPDDSGLASAQEEKAFLENLAGGERNVTEVPATFTDLMDALAAGEHDVWHFSGHGAVDDQQDPNRAVIQLADGEKFMPEQLTGTQANLGKAEPLVFFNACQIGRAGVSLTGLGGWAYGFLAAGASAFMGPMWNVHDNPARDFATTFYTRLLEGNSIAAAVLAARQEIRKYQDATWLAYTLYAHPSASLAREEE